MGSSTAQSHELLQFKGGGEGAVQAAAAHGTAGGGGALPFGSQIQAAFGRHDISNVQAYTGTNAQQACGQMGAEAFATGEKIAFGTTPTLHTAAHEAAHTVQQKGGVALAGGVGQQGDKYEQHADAVADLVVQGRSAEGLLDTMAGGGSTDAVQQQKGPVQMAGPAAPVVLLGMTAAELAGVVSAATGVATAVGAAAAKQNNKSGMGSTLKLAFNKDYLMGPASQANLAQIAKALYFEQCKALMTGGKTQDDVKGVAQGNVKVALTKELDRSAKTVEYSRVENGAGKNTKSTPWGEAIIKLRGGVVSAETFSSTIMATAKEHGIQLSAADRIEYIKSCLVEYSYEEDKDLFSDDDIFVRGQDINWAEADDGTLQISVTVAYDFDGDTIYNKWTGATAIKPGWNIPVPSPTRIGPANPDD